MRKIQTFFNSLNDQELITSYGKLLNTLKKRKIIRSNNLVGDLGEFLAVNIYNSRQDLTNLILAETNEIAYNAYKKSEEDIKFTIKSTSTNMTGIFWGLEPKNSLMMRKYLTFNNCKISN